jgi:hypothetical protein
MCFISEQTTLVSGPQTLGDAPAQRRRATLQQFFSINATGYYSLDSLLLSAFSISTLQVQVLCLTSLQQPQRLLARTLFAGVLLSLQLLPSLLVIKSNTSLTVKVSSTCIYCLF